MKTKTMKQNPTTLIKCKFANGAHKMLEPNIGIKRSQRWKYLDANKFTNEEKISLFDKILKFHEECSNELAAYQFNRREKKRIHKSRVERGYNFNKKNNKKNIKKSELI